jgi:hypothetical protein
MLGICDQEQLAPPEWDSIEQRARLPVSVEDFLDKQGPMPVSPDSRRRYHRMYMRIRAVLRYHETFYAVYMSDISRSGIGFFSPVQLLPCAVIDIWLPDGRQLRLKTKNCVRLEETCYRCGALFAASE